MENMIKWFEKITGNPVTNNILHIFIAIVIMIILIFVSNKIIDLIFNEKRGKCSEEDRRRILTLNKITKMAVKVLIICLVIIDVLSLFIDVKALLTVAGVGTIAIGIGAKAIVEDILSGFMILAENMFNVGEYILIDGNHYGRVEKIGLRMTHIRQLDDSIFIIHNGEITKLTNYSKGTVRAIVLIGIAFEEDINKAFEVLEKLFISMMDLKPDLFLNKPQILGVDELGDSAVMLRIEADVKAENKRIAERFLRKAVKEAFDQNDVEIPYSKYVVIPESDHTGTTDERN